MTQEQIKNAIKKAYSNAERIKSQNGKVLARGEYEKGKKIEMWVDLKNKMIETGYPKK